MVEIREESSETHDGAGSSGTGSSSRPANPPTGTVSFVGYLKQRPTDAVLWALRVATIGFAMLYMFPIGGPQSQASAYSKTLMAGAATNALRMHQRLGGFQLSREFFATMFLEDSCHYLFYCIVFLGCSPVTMALMPVLLFSVLHSSSFTIQLLDAIGQSQLFLRRWLTTLTESYTQNLLSVIACTEIFLMPLVIGMIFMGKASMFLPFIYYRFLTLRYMSRRNPNTRIAFHQMRVALEQSVNRPACPGILRTAAHKLIGLLERLCPSPLLTIVTLILLDPVYTTAYINLNYQSVITYIVAGLTLLYCVVSAVMYAIMHRRDSEAPLTNCSISEVILSGAGMIGWLLVCGISASVSQNTIIDTGERFGWMGACAGLNVALFFGICALFCLNLIVDKVLSTERRSNYGGPKYTPAQRVN
uniref:Gustatory receptor n=1 Tax=Plectus sambesii TaxID=2011161 RepID=A0A914WDB0_9BILA